MNSIHSIDWSRLETNAGNASGIPKALAGLVSEDPSIRLKSYWDIDNVVVCQGDLYESAYYVIPFLIQIIRERPPNGRDLAYEVLIEIGLGWAPEDIDFKKDDGATTSLQSACDEQLAAGRDIFIRDLHDPDLGIQKSAAIMLETRALAKS